MANVITQGKDDLDRAVRVKYIPIADNYKGYSLPYSVGGKTRDGVSKYSKGTLPPHTWTKVSVAVAKNLLDQVKKSKRSRMVPNGSGMESAMGGNKFDQEDGLVRSNLRDETGGEPDYEIQVDGDL